MAAVAQEVGVQRVQPPRRIDRARQRRHAHRRHQSAEERAALAAGVADEGVAAAAAGCELEAAQERGERIDG